MSTIAEGIDTVCELIKEKVQIGFGIASPQASALEQHISNLEQSLATANAFPADWTHKHSIGKGNLASVMWIVFLPPGQTTQDGIYVSFCFGKAGNGLVTGCAISNTSKKKYSYVPTVERKNPLIDVDGTRPGTHYNDGFVNPLEVFAGKVDEEGLLNHIRESVEKCYECLKLETPEIVTVKSAVSEERYETWQRFLDKWPADAISSLVLDDYTSFGGDRDSFCNWIEIHTDALGSIWGGSAYKFGIFEHNPAKSGINDSTRGSDAKYAWYKKYGNSPSEVFPHVKKTILTIINASQSGTLADIDAIDFGHAVKWKIAFLYQSMKSPRILPFYKKEMLVALTGMTKDTPTSKMQKKLMDEKPDDTDLFDYYDELLQRLSENDDEKEEGGSVPMSKAMKPADHSTLGSQPKTNKPKVNLANAEDVVLLRLVAALRAKPFAILAGHSGTGKSRMVRKLAYMTCARGGYKALLEGTDGKPAATPGNFCMVQVKPNWHDSTDLLGYYSEIGSAFRTTDFVKFICKAYAYPDVPFFVCLDEMNLAPVEQYFAEYLSAIESRKVKDDAEFLDGNGDEKTGPKVITDTLLDKSAWKSASDLGCEFTQSAYWVEKHGLTIPRNLFVVGTVNMDESTNQFSRKVLDRAFTLEMTDADFEHFGEQSPEPSYDDYAGDDFVEELLAGKLFASDLTADHKLKPTQVTNLNKLKPILADTSFVVAYRFANEYALYEDALEKMLSQFDSSTGAGGASAGTSAGAAEAPAADGADGAAQPAAADGTQQPVAEGAENSQGAASPSAKPEAFDDMILMKLLPRITGDAELVLKIFAGDENAKLDDANVKGLAGLLEKKGASFKKMKEIVKRGGTSLTFWP